MIVPRRCPRKSFQVALAFLLTQQMVWASPGVAYVSQGSYSSDYSQPMPAESSQVLQLGPQHQGQVLYQGFDQYNQPICKPYQQGPCSRWTMMPDGLIYRPYLASAKESRFRGIWNDERGEGGIWDVSLGGQVGLLRYGHLENGRPVGWQSGIEGAGLARLDRDENYDVMATDYRVGVPLTWGDSFCQVKFGYYHLSSHLGDEFLLKNVGFPRLNFSRDVLVWGISISPRTNWRVYSEAGYAFRTDVSEPWEFQFGVECAPDGATGMRGQPFAAANGHLREEVDFGGNVALQAGWAWRRSPASGMFRLGVEYFNGKSDQFSFFDNSEQKVGFGMWYDY